MRKIQYWGVFAAWVLVLCGGCTCLPEGEPPQGRIVEGMGAAKQEFLLANGVNYMVTELATACLTIPIKAGSRVQILSNSAVAAVLGDRVFSQMSDFVALQKVDSTAEADYILTSTWLAVESAAAGTFEWKMSLAPVDGEPSLWHSTIYIKPPPNQQ